MVDLVLPAEKLVHDVKVILSRLTQITNSCDKCQYTHPTFKKET